MNKYLVCYGDEVVELAASGLSKSKAIEKAQEVGGRSGVYNVRVRLEDPLHPSWPLNFDLREKEETKNEMERNTRG